MANRDRIAHLAFVAGMILKGVDGCLELIGGMALLLTSRAEIRHAVAWLARQELAADPTGFFADRTASMAQHLTAGTQHFATAYLLVHGAIKLVLVAGLLRGIRWVFPTALAILTVFIGYQLYRLTVRPSWLLGTLTLIDVVVVLLVWREWRTRSVVT
ncbi:MAG: DUF2127 domain-containing protein [Rhodanobacteraceae bacterium]